MAKSRGIALIAAVVAVAVLAASAGGATKALPTLKIALHGVKGVSLSTTTVSAGALSVSTTFSGKAPSGPNSNSPSAGIIRLGPGVSFQEAAAIVDGHGGDLDALTPYGALLVSTAAPSTVQTTLTAGNYVALNITGNGRPGFESFAVTRSSSPAALPKASATETSIEFGFRGPTVLHDGTIVRARNGGYLVHMVVLIGVRNAATGRRVMALLRAGKDRQAQKLAGRQFAGLLGPASPGAMQQQVLHTAPGYYVEACFMDTLDHREHTQLGMERLIRVVK